MGSIHEVHTKFGEVPHVNDFFLSLGVYKIGHVIFKKTDLSGGLIWGVTFNIVNSTEEGLIADIDVVPKRATGSARLIELARENWERNSPLKTPTFPSDIRDDGWLKNLSKKK